MYVGWQSRFVGANVGERDREKEMGETGRHSFSSRVVQLSIVGDWTRCSSGTSPETAETISCSEANGPPTTGRRKEGNKGAYHVSNPGLSLSFSWNVMPISTQIK